MASRCLYGTLKLKGGFIMKDIIFTELNFAGYERKHKLTVDQYRTTKNQNGTFNVICKIEGDMYIFNNCSYPQIIK